MQALTIGHLAKESGVNLETVRYYERRGLLPKPPRSASGYRLFPAEATRRLRFIQRAKELEVEQQPPAPILLGRHLLDMGLPPGPTVGEITKAVYEMQLDGRVATLDDAREVAKKMLSADYADYTD